MNTISEVMKKKYQLEGTERSDRETQLLNYMLYGFADIVINQDAFKYLGFLHEACDLSNYHDYTKNDAFDYGYTDLTAEGKIYFHCMTVLNALSRREWVQKKTLVSNDFSPEEGWTDYSDEKLDGTDAGNLAWLSRALSSSENSHFQYPEYLKSIDGPPVVFSVDRIVYSLTPKGYEIAHKQQEHTDQNRRFLQQQELNKQSLEISKSSALTAKIALFVGSAIAISSALNVYFSHF